MPQKQSSDPEVDWSLYYGNQTIDKSIQINKVLSLFVVAPELFGLADKDFKNWFLLCQFCIAVNLILQTLNRKLYFIYLYKY